MFSPNIQKIINSQIAIEWMTICLSKESGEGGCQWIHKKEAFWKEHGLHLWALGFSKNREIDRKPLKLRFEKIDELEHSLLLAIIGTDTLTPSKGDMDQANEVMKTALDGVVGVQFVVLPKKF